MASQEPYQMSIKVVGSKCRWLIKNSKPNNMKRYALQFKCKPLDKRIKLKKFVADKILHLFSLKISKFGLSVRQQEIEQVTKKQYHPKYFKKSISFKLAVVMVWPIEREIRNFIAGVSIYTVKLIRFQQEMQKLLN